MDLQPSSRSDSMGDTYYKCLLELGALTSLGWMSVFAELATGLQEPSQHFCLQPLLRLDY